MDYSQNETEYPGGGDPWASSPQRNRTSFGQPPTSDISSSPLPPQASPYGQDSEQYGYMDDNSAAHRPGTASTESGDHAAPAQPSQNAPQLPQPQRYHGTRPQRQQQQQQQQHYKLHAKVTGLERNGKKDPIIRFDVYVRVHGERGQDAD